MEGLVGGRGRTVQTKFSEPSQKMEKGVGAEKNSGSPALVMKSAALYGVGERGREYCEGEARGRQRKWTRGRDFHVEWVDWKGEKSKREVSPRGGGLHTRLHGCVIEGRLRMRPDNRIEKGKQ